jgi:hypothetical protein
MQRFIEQYYSSATLGRLQHRCRHIWSRSVEYVLCVGFVYRYRRNVVRAFVKMGGKHKQAQRTKNNARVSIIHTN